MNAGRLRHRVTLQRLVKDRNDFGEVVDAWEDQARFWAEVKPIAGKETFIAKQFAAQTSHEVWCRYRKGIKASDRIIDHRGNTLDIKAVLDVGGRGCTLKLLCRETGC
ncbi:phage head closure protein [Candidatus Sororendozoicomonas aggregata]|uniref:phage head closure protein n=1 Tax=Candidatus Sororendozoicomonas aggregata TaxID=3073239 RepID=UPI002ED6A1E0